MPRFMISTILAASITLPMMANAQDNTQGQNAGENAGQATAQEEALAVVAPLGLVDAVLSDKSHDPQIHGTLPGGTAVEIDLDRNGAIEEIEARGNGLFAIAEIAAVIPEAVLANASWPVDAQLEKVEFERDGRIEIEGYLADGREFDASFSAAGELIELDIDD